MAILELRDIYKSYDGEPVLDGITISLGRGETIGIAGPNGCGKTTLLKIAAGIERPDRGTVAVKGTVALIPQDNLLLPWKTLRANIMLALKPLRLPPEEAERRVEETAKLLSIEEYLNRYPRHVSGGTARKAAIARALVTSPDVLLLDEPYTGLDVAAVHALRETLKSLAKSRRTSMIIVSHQIAELLGTVEKIYLLSHRPAKVTRVIETTTHAAESVVNMLYTHGNERKT